MNTHMGEDPAARSTRRVQQLQHSQDAEQQTPAKPGAASTFPGSSHEGAGTIGLCPAWNQLKAHALCREDSESGAKPSNGRGVLLELSSFKL